MFKVPLLYLAVRREGEEWGLRNESIACFTGFEMAGALRYLPRQPRNPMARKIAELMNQAAAIFVFALFDKSPSRHSSTAANSAATRNSAPNSSAVIRTIAEFTPSIS